MYLVYTYDLLPKSLESPLEAQRSKDPIDFSKVRQKFPSEEELAMLTLKGVFPQSCLDSFERFEQNLLPSKQAFYNKLF